MPRALVPAGALCLLLAAPVPAQDLAPRAYANVPVNATFLILGLGVSQGAVVSDPTLPIQDIDAKVATPSVGLARSLSLFGRTAQAFGAMPYSWADVSGKVFEEARSVSRAGLSDMQFRFSVLVRGAPAVSAGEFARAPRRTILGTSLTVIAPTGEFLTGKLINLGTNRWSFKPEFAVSQPIRARWLLDAYGAVWFFTANDSFYPGTAKKTQAPIGAFQGHISYNIRPRVWAAFDATYYVGGRTTVQGLEGNDLLSNSRAGGTLVLPIGKRHSVKLAVSRGAIIRYGANFTTYSIGWQTGWVPRPKPAP